MVKKQFLPLLLLGSIQTSLIFSGHMARGSVADQQNQTILRAVATSVFVAKTLQMAHEHMLPVVALANGDLERQITMLIKERSKEAHEWVALFGNPSDYGMPFQTLVASAITTHAETLAAFSQGLSTTIAAISTPLQTTLKNVSGYLNDELTVVGQNFGSDAETALETLIFTSLTAMHADIQKAINALPTTAHNISTLVLTELKKVDHELAINPTQISSSITKSAKTLSAALNLLLSDFQSCLVDKFGKLFAQKVYNGAEVIAFKK
jgi:hypothetical protein